MAFNIFENLNKIKNTNSLNLIIMDCIMPIKDGYDSSLMIKNLIETKNYANCYIIAYTANTGDDDIKKCEKSRMDSYLIKPCSQNEFELLISSILDKI